MRLEIKLNSNALDSLEKLSGEQIKTANVRAINTALRKVNTLYRREVTKHYNLRYSDTKDISFVQRATRIIQEGKILAEINPISLSRFRPMDSEHKIQGYAHLYNVATKKKRSVKRTFSHRVAGVEVEIKRGNVVRIPFAFRINSEKPGIIKQIWARGIYNNNQFKTGKSRKPITPLKTLSPYGALTIDATRKSVEIIAIKEMAKEHERQINLLLKQDGK